MSRVWSFWPFVAVAVVLVSAARAGGETSALFDTQAWTLRRKIEYGRTRRWRPVPKDGAAHRRAGKRRGPVQKVAFQHLVAVIAGAFAFSTATLIYTTFILPRLPEWTSVPGYWWLIQLTPIVLLLTGIGYLAPTAIRVLSWCAAAFFPWQIGWVAIMVARPQPVRHDLWPTDSLYYASVFITFSLAVVLAFACYWLRQLANRRRGGRGRGIS